MSTAVAIAFLTAFLQVHPAAPDVHATAHFRIEHDTDSVEAERLGECLERTYDAVLLWCHELVIPTEAPRVSMEVRLFDRFEDFSKELLRLSPSAAQAVGLYDAKANAALFCRLDRLPAVGAVDQEIGRMPARPETDELSRRRDQLVAELRQLVHAHEAAHQVLNNVGVFDRTRSYPPWLVEGLACQFESACSPGDSRVNSPRIADLAMDLITASALRDLIAQSPKLTAPPEYESERYALAYLLVEYLRHERIPDFKSMMRNMSADLKEEPLEFEKHFGPIDESLVVAMRRRLDALRR